MGSGKSGCTFLKPGTRMLSIDALRGLDMFFITGLGATLQTLCGLRDI